jgi:hypothetical protein
MGLFNFFKKKNSQQNFSSLSLEELLQNAAAKPEYRPEFYKRLLSDKLVVITTDNGQPDGQWVAKENTTVNIVNLADGKIPVFTSKEKIFDKGIVKEQVRVLELKGEDLFNMTKGATLILNPYSDYGKELLPLEIEQMLNGTILTASHQKITVEKDTSVQLGQPANYPTEIVNALRSLFSKNPNVKAAYLGWIYNPSSGQPAHYIFAIDGNGDLQNLTDEAGFIAQQYLKPEEIVDFLRLNNKGGINDYFLKETKPFYTK